MLPPPRPMCHGVRRVQLTALNCCTTEPGPLGPTREQLRLIPRMLSNEVVLDGRKPPLSDGVRPAARVAWLCPFSLPAVMPVQPLAAGPLTSASQELRDRLHSPEHSPRGR